jgi:hypothetical protein
MLTTTKILPKKLKYTFFFQFAIFKNFLINPHQDLKMIVLNFQNGSNE